MLLSEIKSGNPGLFQKSDLVLVANRNLVPLALGVFPYDLVEHVIV